MRTDFSYYCDNIGQVGYDGHVAFIITAQDPVGMLTGSVAMNLTVASVNYSNRQCSTAIISGTQPIVADGGFAFGTSVRVNTDMGPIFGSYWGTNQLLFFSGTLNGNTITGTITGMTDGGTGGTTGTFTVTKQ